MLRTLVLLVGSFVAFSAVNLPAQDAVLGQLYGNGVHAYFAGDFVKAHDQLTAAVTAGSRDPRVYYYRGLAFLKLGRQEEAVEDFKQGAALESKDLNRSFNVARSLERVQGSARQQLETYRVEARLAAFEEAKKVQATRFEAIKREEDRVLRNQASKAPAVSAANPAGESPAKTAETDPFGNPQTEKKAGEAKVVEEPVEEPKAEQPKAEKPDDAGDFGSGAMAEKPAEDAKTNPFKEEPAVSPEKSTAENKGGPVKQSILSALLKGGASSIKKSVPKGVSGMGNMMPGKGMPGMVAPGGAMPAGAVPAGADPFGGGTEEKAAPPKQPGTEGKAGEDPFGAGTEEKAAPPKQPAEGKPGDDPFGSGAEEKKADAPEKAAPKEEEAAPPKKAEPEKTGPEADPFG